MNPKNVSWCELKDALRFSCKQSFLDPGNKLLLVIDPSIYTDNLE